MCHDVIWSVDPARGPGPVRSHAVYARMVRCGPPITVRLVEALLSALVSPFLARLGRPLRYQMSLAGSLQWRLRQGSVYWRPPTTMVFLDVCHAVGHAVDERLQRPCV